MKSVFVFRLIALSALLAVSGCGGHGKAARAAAAMFKRHHDNFLAVIKQAADCTGAGTITVFYDGTVPDTRDPRGAPSCPDPDGIARNLKAAGVRMAFITADPPYGADGKGMGVVFVISSRDDFQQTQGSAIYYFNQAQEHRRHFTALPDGGGHWFYRIYAGMAIRIG